MIRNENDRMHPTKGIVAGLLGLVLLPLVFGGCDSDDCVNCVEMDPPVVPTGVHSISQDNNVIVQWYDISYSPYDGEYNPNVVSYIVYSRFYQEGDEDIGDREFYVIGEVAWDENYDNTSGLHWFEDLEAENGERYEYAVSAVNAAGAESALSYEFVIDAPLPMDEDPVRIYGANDASDEYSILSGFDFSDLDSQPVDPFAVDSPYDIRIYFEDNVPYVQTAGDDVKIQDFGTFWNGSRVVFEGVSWAPAVDYSTTGVLELINGHVYVLQIDGAELHYAKFGVTDVDAISVDIIWAYQTIPGLPELQAPPERQPDPEHRQISL